MEIYNNDVPKIVSGSQKINQHFIYPSIAINHDKQLRIHKSTLTRTKIRNFLNRANNKFKPPLNSTFLIVTI